MVSVAILTAVAQAVVGALAGKVADGLLAKLRGDPAQNALKQALGAAIQRYATGERLLLARPLTRRDGPLSRPDVANEIAQLIHFEREPDYQLMGRRWREASDRRRPLDHFVAQAKLLMDYLEDELRRTAVFRPVFDSKALDAIAADAEVATEFLASIELQLEELIELIDTRFGELIAHIVNAPDKIRDQIYYFDRYVGEKSAGFVGRQWVFDAVNRFIHDNQRGYFFVIGEPGIGKSALAAQMVKREGYVHHFNIRAERINKASTFLRNVCAQLIAEYDLEYGELPSEAGNDAGFLNKLLSEISNKIGPNERCVIVVDALDEVDAIGMPSGTNLLYLPITLPANVYVIVTMRDDERIMPRVDCERDELRIRSESSDNLTDVADFIQAWTVRSGIQAYIAAQRIEPQQFVAMMVKKSEGNFMYLRYVMPEIARGTYKDRELAAIPSGLQNYYEDHWRRMRGQDEGTWFDYKLPVIVALTAAREPVSIDLIKMFSKVDRTSRIQNVLQEWEPFLYEEEVEYEGARQRRYRLYHASFFDFIAAKQEVEGERVDLKAAHGQISDTLWSGLFRDEEKP